MFLTCIYYTSSLNLVAKIKGYIGIRVNQSAAALNATDMQPERH
jgi:hypothetical protein